jgi:HPr kinase/phosphorylase
MAKQLKKAIKTEMIENEVDISVAEFCTELGLEVIRKGSRESMHISTFNINRPGLQLAGFYEHFGGERVQVIGEQETAYLERLDPGARAAAVDAFFRHRFPCVVISSGLKAAKEIMDAAEKDDRVVLGTHLRSTVIMNELSIFLNELLAPKVTVHGGLMDIYGVGVLILGKSSVGKSETALELLQRSHRLVADDAVCIRRVSDRLVGTSPEVIRYFMEVRGIGIIDVRSMYGAGSVLQEKEIDLVVKLEEWDGEKEYNRLGDDLETYNILDVELPMHTIPVKTGRNLAVILEVAAGNYRLKSMGYNALGELEERKKRQTGNGGVCQ